MGAQRRQHHRQQEAMRAATAEANRQRAMMEAQQKAFQEQLKMQRESMLAQTKAMREATAPKTTTLSQAGIGIKLGGSKKKTAASMAKGASSLKIPLNVGSNTGSGLNIG